MANKTVSITTIPTRSDSDTVASYNVYTDKPSANTLVGTLTPAEALAGKVLVFADGLNHNATAKTVWTTAGESTTNVSNIVVVDLTSVTWTVLGGSYDSIATDISSDTTSAMGIFFKPDGTKVFITDNVAARTIFEYPLSTAWDITSLGVKSSVLTEGSTTTGLFFKPDGTKVFYLKQSSSELCEKTLSTAWDITSAGATTLLSSGIGGMIGLHMNNTGTKIYITNNLTSVIAEWVLSTAYDISTAAASTTFDATAQGTGFYGIFFSDDGLKMFVNSETTDCTVYEYDLSTAWLISSAAYSGNSMSLATQDNNQRGLFIKPDGTKLYGSGITANASIYQYSMG